MAAQFDEIAEALAQTYRSIEQVLSEAQVRLDRTRENVAYVAGMDPGLRATLQNDLDVASRILRQLGEKAANASTTLHQYSVAIQAGAAL